MTHEDVVALFKARHFPNFLFTVNNALLSLTSSRLSSKEIIHKKTSCFEREYVSLFLLSVQAINTCLYFFT